MSHPTVGNTELHRLVQLYIRMVEVESYWFWQRKWTMKEEYKKVLQNFKTSLQNLSSYIEYSNWEGNQAAKEIMEDCFDRMVIFYNKSKIT